MRLLQPPSPSEIRRKGTREVALRLSGPPAGSDLRDADLRRCDLKRRNLSGLNLTLASFAGADLRHADLTNAILDGADLSGADLRGARLDGARLFGANLQHARLPATGARILFKDADLRHAQFDFLAAGEAPISGCSFVLADVRGADLRGVRFERCSFRGADLTGARMHGTPLRRRLCVHLAGGVASGCAVFLAAHSLPRPIGEALWHWYTALSPVWQALLATTIGIPAHIWNMMHPGPARLEACDFAGALEDVSTRWPWGFALARRLREPCPPEE